MIKASAPKPHLTPEERLAVVLEVDALPTTAARRARLRELGVSWGTWWRWRALYRAHGLDGLQTRRTGRPTAYYRDRLAALELRVEALERKR